MKILGIFENFENFVENFENFRRFGIKRYKPVGYIQTDIFVINYTLQNLVKNQGGGGRVIVKNQRPSTLFTVYSKNQIKIVSKIEIKTF